MQKEPLYKVRQFCISEMQKKDFSRCLVRLGAVGVVRDDVLQDAYRRAIVVDAINEAIEDAMEMAMDEAENATVPKTLRRQLRAHMKENPDMPWDKALATLAEKKRKVK